MTSLENLLGAFLIMGVFSYALYKESPYFRFCEHAFLGTAMGYTLVQTVKTISTTAINPLTKGQVIYVVPILFGLLLYSRYVEEYIWLSRWSTSLIVGVGVALGMRGVLLTYIISQTRTAASLPLIGETVYITLNNILMGITTLFILVYFTFTMLKGEGKTSTMFQVRRVSRMLIMVMLGAFFGSITMARLSLIAGQIRELLIAFGLLVR